MFMTTNPCKRVASLRRHAQASGSAVPGQVDGSSTLGWHRRQAFTGQRPAVRHPTLGVRLGVRRSAVPVPGARCPASAEICSADAEGAGTTRGVWTSGQRGVHARRGRRAMGRRGRERLDGQAGLVGRDMDGRRGQPARHRRRRRDPRGGRQRDRRRDCRADGADARRAAVERHRRRRLPAVLGRASARGARRSRDGARSRRPRRCSCATAFPMPTAEAIVGGRSVGAPGVLRMLALAHRRYGLLPWPRLFAPAIRLAEEGFAISPRLARLLSTDESLASDPDARAHFFTSRWPARSPSVAACATPPWPRCCGGWPTRVPTPSTRATSRRRSRRRCEPHPTNPGLLTAADIAAYRPIERVPLCFDYRDARICGFPPPSSRDDRRGADPRGAGVARPEGLAPDAYRRGPLAAVAGPGAPLRGGGAARVCRSRCVCRRSRLRGRPRGGADRCRRTSAQRAALVGDRSMGRALPGHAAGRAIAPRVAAVSLERPSTSHISVVDRFGNALSMTTTIEDGFGSRQMVRGFMLNNQLTDFSLAPRTADGTLVANRVRARQAAALVDDAAARLRSREPASYG